MRALKFRAWHKKYKRMYEVLHLHAETLMNGGVWADVKGNDIIKDKDIVIQIQPKDIEIMQYTGLHDKNGKEIYEGDIVEFNDFASLRTGGHVDDNIVIGKVQFLYGGWMVDSKEGHYDLYEAVINDEEIEVIGNIYEDGE